MKMTHIALRACAVMPVAVLAFARPGLADSAEARPLLSMRLRANDTDTLAIWEGNFKAVAAHPGCCDEIWFSTGCGVPSLDWHRARAEVIAQAARDVRTCRIEPSLQFQATLGHGDAYGTPELFACKDWTGWTGPTGVETKFCNCPRQPKFMDYLRAVSRIYAPLGFRALWIDDDLRISAHQPSGSFGKRSGCWCATCLAAFNAETGAKWTRPDLAQAVSTNAALATRWRRFQIKSLSIVASAVAEVFHEISPTTMLALQHACYDEQVDQVGEVLKTLHAVSGRPVGFRPGGGAYYDDDPNGLVKKSLQEGWFRARIGNPDFVCVWTPEIESWPRTYYSRSPQGVLVEGFTALMYGMNSISFFISNGQKESPDLFGSTYWSALAAAAPVLRGYAQAVEGSERVGFDMPGAVQLGIRRAAIPILVGVGRRVGSLSKKESERNVNRMTSADVQAFRDELDRRAGGLSAVVSSPFSGLMQLHESAGGDFRALALVNTRISVQGPVRVKLRRAAFPTGKAVWHEMRHAPLSLPLEGQGSDLFVTIPSVDAWNGGYLAE